MGLLDRLFPGFGELNPIEPAKIGKSLDTRNTSATDAIRQAALDVYKTDSFANTGPLKGIVLRVDNNPQNNDPNSWISRVFGALKIQSLKTLKVRIPEIHAALPEPSKYGNNAEEANKVIDMYPSFISINEEVSNKPVAPGDIVSVDFVNRVNLSQPIYLGPVLSNPNPGAVGEKSVKSIVEDNTKTTLQVAPPVGDNIMGTKDEANQIPQPAVVVKENDAPVTKEFVGNVSKPKAKLIPVVMDKARSGFSKGAGYPKVRVREDIAENLAQAKIVLNKLGAVMVSVGTVRDLGAPVSQGRVATSFHYTALAIDLWTEAGMHPSSNPETDEYVIEFDKTEPTSHGLKFIVWARTDLSPGTTVTTEKGTFSVEQKELDALDVRKTVKISGPKQIKISGNFVNLTQIMLAHGFIRIGGHKEFYTKSIPGTAEWWHFESHNGLVVNQTRFRDVLNLVYDDNGEPPYKFGNYIWTGSYFKPA